MATAEAVVGRCECDNAAIASTMAKAKMAAAAAVLLEPATEDTEAEAAVAATISTMAVVLEVA